MKSGPGLPGKITNRNYTDEDYKKMTQAQRDELRALRQSDISCCAQQAHKAGPLVDAVTHAGAEDVMTLAMRGTSMP